MTLFRRALALLSGAALIALIVGTAIPMLPYDTGLIRAFDFPRMQFALLLMAFLLLHLVTARKKSLWLGGLALAALAVQAATIWPYQPFAQEMARSVTTCPDERRIRLVISNVQLKNRDAPRLEALVDQTQPDLLLLMETGHHWADSVSRLSEEFALHFRAAPPDEPYYAMDILSQHPLEETRFEYPFGSDTPLLITRVAHPAGPFQLIGIHPKPPEEDRPATLRDGTVLHAAQLARDSDLPTVIAGDYNAAPWEATSQLALRAGGLLDPRVGRSAMASYKTSSPILRWPLDHVLIQPGFGLMDFRRLEPIGSDHFPFLADLCLLAETDAPGGTPLSMQDGDQEAVDHAISAAIALSPKN